MKYIKEVTEALQRRALEECGVSPGDLEEAMIALHNHRYDYRGDEEVLPLSY
tara:strand:- start:269 stop:424 length:156 start_codon:yes stop_codon:yes gene_type:complete